MMWYRTLTQNSFKQQLLLSLALSVLILAVVTSLLTSWIIVQRLQALVIDYTAQMTWQLGANSVYVFLTLDDGLAKRILANIKAFPGVRYVALLKPDFTPLAAEGIPVTWTPANQPGAWQVGPTLAGEDDDSWHFAAPVSTRPVIRPNQETPAATERLGYVQIAWDKTLLATLRVRILAVTTGISVMLASLLVLWLHTFVNRLTAPLNGLIKVMLRAPHESGVRANLAGTQETREMASVFNGLLAKLEQHQASLEAEVAIRTLELREARDAALTAVRHKSEFLATTTHEMRAPLHVMLGYTQLALEELAFLDDDSTLIRHHLETALKSAEGLKRRIDQILEFARFEAGKMEVQIQAIDLQHLIDQLLDMVQPLARRRSNVLRSELQGERYLDIDGDKIYQILLELLDNACKFTDHGLIQLRANCTAQALVIEVMDTGIGIPPDQQALIFEPFRQLDMSETRSYGGTGLGLAITQRFCELLGGAITVASEPGHGARFRVTLPRPINPTVSEVTLEPISPIEAAG